MAIDIFFPKQQAMKGVCLIDLPSGVTVKAVCLCPYTNDLMAKVSSHAQMNTSK